MLQLLIKFGRNQPIAANELIFKCLVVKFCNNLKYVRRTTVAVCGLDFDERSSHTIVIRRHYVFLLETLDLTDLVPELYSKQVLSPVERDDIRAEKRSFLANEKFLSVLSRKSPQQFQQFLDALSCCRQQHVRNVIDAAV